MRTFLSSTLLLAVAVCGSLHGQDKDDSVAAGGLTFKVAEPWKKVEPSSSMRAGQLQFKDNKGVDAVFFFFGPRSGSAEANLKRWEAQFQGAPETKTEKKKHGDAEVTYFTAKGTYLDGPPFGGAKTPKDDFIMLAAIVPGPQGDVYVKLVGPAKTIGEATDPFNKLVASAFDK